MKENITEEIKAALYYIKVEKLNEMQQSILEKATIKKDIVLLSPTGTGKTIAYALSILKCMEKDCNKVQTMIIAPSRELAIQINKVFSDMKTYWRCYCCYGGHSVIEEKKFISECNPSIIIGTPGRLLDHLKRKSFFTDSIKTIVIDEFDKLLEFGFQEEMQNIINVLSSLTRRILVSATDSEEIPHYVQMNNTIKLDYLQKNEEVQSRIELMKVLSPENDKIKTLYALLCLLGNASSIVFCNHRESVDRVNKLLLEMNFPNERFHGGMEQKERERSLYKFMNGSTPTLISTDLASRGLDIPSVKHIIHYHLPVNEESFIHRNGRTARWKAKGSSFFILNEEEQLPEYIKQEVSEYNIPAEKLLPPIPIWKTLYIGKGKKDKLSKGDVAGFIYKKGGLQKEDIGSIEVKENASFIAIKGNKMKQLLQLVNGEKIKGIKTIIEEAR